MGFNECTKSHRLKAGDFAYAHPGIYAPLTNRAVCRSSELFEDRPRTRNKVHSVSTAFIVSPSIHIQVTQFFALHNPKNIKIWVLHLDDYINRRHTPASAPWLSHSLSPSLWDSHNSSALFWVYFHNNTVNYSSYSWRNRTWSKNQGCSPRFEFLRPIFQCS
jgi:hypothetical protein